jgi:hypothetical protein
MTRIQSPYLYRSGSLQQKYSRLSEVSQPGYIGWDYVAWRAGTKSANLDQSCLKLRLRVYGA